MVNILRCSSKPKERKPYLLLHVSVYIYACKHLCLFLHTCMSNIVFTYLCQTLFSLIQINNSIYRILSIYQCSPGFTHKYATNTVPITPI